MHQIRECLDKGVLQDQITEAESNARFAEARMLQEHLVHLMEGDQSSTSGCLGDAIYKLATLSYRCRYFKAAQMDVARAIGYRRMFFGKGHAKVAEAVDLAKVIQVELSKVDPPRRRRKSIPV